MNLDPDVTFGVHLRRLREVAGLTQQQLADMVTEAGCTMYRSTIAKIEADQRTVSLGEAIQFAAALGIGLSDIADGHMGQQLSEQLRITSLKYRVSELTRLRDETQILLDDALGKLQRATSGPAPV